MNDKHSQVPPEALAQSSADANEGSHKAYGNGNVRIYKGWVQQLCEDGKWRLLPEIENKFRKFSRRRSMDGFYASEFKRDPRPYEDEIKRLLGPDVLEADE